MPDKIIAIPGVGNIAFPDTMSDDDIAAASKKIYDEKQGAFSMTAKAESPSWLDLGVEAVKGAVNQVNPLPMLKQLYDEQQGQATKALQEGGIRGALRAELKTGLVAAGAQVLGGLALAQWDQVKKAKAAYDAGDYSTALGHTAAAVLPVFGPPAAAIGEQIATGDLRQIARGIGGTVGLVAPLGAAEALKRSRGIPLVPGLTNPNAVERAAVAFGQREGIPIDVATATGSKFIRGAQKMVESTPIGGIVETNAEAARAAALKATGEKLAGQAASVPATPETAGAGVRSSLENLIGQLHGQANEAYGKLRDIESAGGEYVSTPEPALTGTIRSKAYESLGRVPSPAEITELRRMVAELDAMPFKRGALIDEKPGIEGSQTYYDYRAPGAPVYHDILNAAPEHSSMTRADVQRSVQTAIDSGLYNNVAKGALEVARDRLKGGVAASEATLPPSAGERLPTFVQMPTDLRYVKAALQPIYERLKRQMPITQQQASPGLKALENIVSGPDFAPLSQADADLSALKSIARGAESPYLRDVSQGLAAKAVREMDQAVQEAAKRAGPEAVQALEEGRSATKAKYAAAGVLDQLRQEPVQAYRQATARGDSAIGYLRDLREMAPDAIPAIGRAWIEDAVTKATRTGGFKRGQGLLRDWENLGPETKRILFGPELSSDLDKFFLLAERLGESPNPSRTALTLMAGHSAGVVGGLYVHPIAGSAYLLGTGAIAKLLNSSAGVRLLTKGLRTPALSKVAAGPVVAEILKLAGDDVAPLPLAAGDERQQPAAAGPR